MTLTIAETLAFARAQPWTETDARIAVAVAIKESSLNPRAHNTKPPDNSYGLMQINMFDKLGPSRRAAFGLTSNDQLFDPATNMKAAYSVWKWSGWNAWSTYKSNSYLSVLPAVEAVANPQGVPMGRYPGAVYREVVGLSKDPPIRPIGIILHVSASNSPSLFNYFNGPSGGVESHFHIPLNPGQVEQYRDTNREADANYKGNSWIEGGERLGFISVETAGLGDGEWNDYQLRELEKMIRWCAATHKFPLRVAPGYHSPGIGYHVQFGSGEGTNSWSNARGKICPGPKRIAQIKNVLMPRLTSGSTPSPGPTPPSQNRVLREGMSGQDVAEWQQLLVRAGYPVSTDGAFGPKTTAATKQAQSRVGAAPDGVVGPDTRARVNQLVNPPAPPPPPKETELFKPRTGDIVVISPEHSGLVLDLPALGKSSDLVACYKLDGGGDQRWEIVQHQDQPPTGEVSFVTLGEKGERLVLDVNDGANAGKPGQQVAVWDAHFGGQQRFRIESLETGNNKIVHVGSGLCLEVRDSGGMSAPLQLAEWKGTPNQRFRFVGTV